MITLGLIYVVLFTAIFILIVGSYIGLSQMFEKADEPAWKAAIPIYNVYTLFNITWRKLWFWVCIVDVLVMIIAYIYIYIATFNLVFLGETINSSLIFALSLVCIITLIIACVIGIMLNYHIASAYSDSVFLMTLGLTFFGGIFYMVLGFGCYEYMLEDEYE